MTVPSKDTRSDKRESFPPVRREAVGFWRPGSLGKCGVLLATALAFGVPAGWAQQPVAPTGAAAPDAGLDAPAQKAQNPPTAIPSSVPQATSPVGVASGGAAAIDASRYIIGSDDVLQLTVWKEPTLSGNVPVRPDGMISMVLLGDIPATGMTPMQLGANITERLKKYIQDPSVTVVVTAVNSQKIFLIGEVQHVGAITLSPGMTPLQAVSAAGGLTNYANGKRIYILRGAAGKQEKIPFNYKQALKGDSHQMIALHPGDTIVVP